MAKCRVIADWQASYENPFAVKKGDEFWLSGKSEDWDGHIWLWAKDARGREGWVPDNLAGHHSEKTYAKFDFSALELTCIRNEELQIMDETHGWILCRNNDGQQGWVPAGNVSNR